MFNFLKKLFFPENKCKDLESFIEGHQVHEEDVLNRLSNIENKILILEKQKAALIDILNKIEQLINDLKVKAK